MMWGVWLALGAWVLPGVVVLGWAVVDWLRGRRCEKARAAAAVHAAEFAAIADAMPDVAALGRQLLDADLYLIPMGGDGRA